MTDSDLLGYLLQALDPYELRQVEARLESCPESRRKLVTLRRALQPLEADRSLPEPRPSLVVNTLRSISEEHCRRETTVRSRPTVTQPAVHGRSLWRRMDVLVAACIALVVLAMVPPALLRVRAAQEIAACKDNLRNFHPAFVRYSEDHNGDMPFVAPDGPRALAGVYAVSLRQPQYWNAAARIACPANYHGPLPDLPTLEELDDQFKSDHVKYEEWCSRLGGCYGYNFGYEDTAGVFRPVNTRMGNMVPLLSDRPPRVREGCYSAKTNSPNHGGRGQNILQLGGNVIFLTTRNFGPDNDIFLNRRGIVAVGQGERDIVLAPSEAKPYPK